MASQQLLPETKTLFFFSRCYGNRLLGAWRWKISATREEEATYAHTAFFRKELFLIKDLGGESLVPSTRTIKLTDIKIFTTHIPQSVFSSSGPQYHLTHHRNTHISAILRRSFPRRPHHTQLLLTRNKPSAKHIHN